MGIRGLAHEIRTFTGYCGLCQCSSHSTHHTLLLRSTCPMSLLGRMSDTSSDLHSTHHLQDSHIRHHILNLQISLFLGYICVTSPPRSCPTPSVRSASHTSLSESHICHHILNPQVACYLMYPYMLSPFLGHHVPRCQSDHHAPHHILDPHMSSNLLHPHIPCPPAGGRSSFQAHKKASCPSIQEVLHFNQRTTGNRGAHTQNLAVPPTIRDLLRSLGW